MAQIRENINKECFSLLIDIFEADIQETTSKAFNKRSSVSRRGGRPYTYSPREIGEQMVAYFRNCVENNQPLMITGICLRLDISRTTLFNLEKSRNSEFVNTIKKGKQIVESYLESQLHLNPNPRAPIFILKNMGWKN